MSNATVQVPALRDLFGEPIAPRDVPSSPGSGPTGETCGTCTHLSRIRKAKTYLKCALLRAHWTGGPGTDIRARTPACHFWTAPPNADLTDAARPGAGNNERPSAGGAR